MNCIVFLGILLPFIGTTLGAFLVFFSKKTGSDSKALSGFAAGVMVAASVWSLIIPAVEMSEKLGIFAFLPMLSGFWFGLLFLIITETALSRFTARNEVGRLSFLIAVVLHNIPEGMAVGVAFAAAAATGERAIFTGALLLSFGMAMQNIPEGAIISLPLKSSGTSKAGSFLLGSLSGIVEPIAAIITMFFSSSAQTVLPVFLGFAAGAMIYVSVSELIPKAHGLKGALWFCMGFSVMMVLDIALG